MTTFGEVLGKVIKLSSPETIGGDSGKRSFTSYLELGNQRIDDSNWHKLSALQRLAIVWT